MPERLALENALDAEAHGGAIVNYSEVVSNVPEDGSSAARGARHHERRRKRHLRARRRQRNGAWWEQVAAAQTGHRSGRIRTTKGIHIVCLR